MQRTAVLGSTGSIGQQTLEVIAELPDQLSIVALAAGHNAGLLFEQVRKFHPQLVSLSYPASSVYSENIGDASLLCGPQSLVDLATHPDVDLVVIATAGRAGLAPTLAAIRAGKTIALANKEVLVMAGELVMSEAKRHGAEIRPIDSEHSAIWQCLQGEQKDGIIEIWLTASGGPFRNYSVEQLERVTPAKALQHPNWKMGTKVTIDSATLMNKGFEVIEAHWLFGLAYDQIKVLIHHQSIIHSMIEFVDGSIKAQLSMPDMRLPIQYALTYPERRSNNFRHVDWQQIQALSFEQPDPDRFACLRLAYQAGQAGGTYPAVLSAADEVVVDLFLHGKIKLTEIPAILQRALDSHCSIEHPTCEDILAADEWGRNKALSFAS